MTEKTVRLCPTCGREIDKTVYKIGEKIFCEKCKPAEDGDKTIALGAQETDKTVAFEAEETEKTVALGADETEKTMALGKETPGADQTLDETIPGDKTVAVDLEAADRTAALQDQTIASQTEKTQATTFYTVNKSMAATKVIKDVLKIAPDVDLEHASRMYFNRKGKDVGEKEAATINDLISHSGEDKKYIFDKELGRGGMGAVFATVDQDIRRKVAMKVILPHAQTSVPHIKRFLEEAQVTGQLEHPNIVPVHDIGIDEESQIYFTMQMVRGEDLESIINKISKGDEQYRQKYSLGTLIQNFMKICEGVGYAHSKGVLHRDIKPENVMVGSFGEVMVMDWGLAKVLGRDDIQTKDGSEPSPDTASSYVTMEGQVMGTPSYMSPEQAMGKISELDERSDIFSLGGILYKILTGEAPYKGKNAREALEKAKKRMLQAPDLRKPATQVPPELNAICMKAMARDKEDRYPDAMALKNDLQLYLDGKSVSAKKDNLFIRTKKWVIRNKVAAMGIAAAIVCLVIGIIFTALYEQKKKQDTIVQLLTQGDQQRQTGSYEAAEETFFSVLGLDPGNDQARTGIALVSGKALALKNKRLAKEKIREAQRLFEAGEYIKAYDAYVATFTLDPESPEALDGVKVSAVKADKQKAQQKIKPILAETKGLAEQSQSLDKQLIGLRKKIKQAKSRIKGYEGFSTKKSLWEEEKLLLSKEINRLKTEGKIISRYSTVLSYDGENKEARKSLARIYYDKFKEAESLKNSQDMAYFKELVLTFDDGHYRDLLTKDGTLTLTTTPRADAFYLFRYVEGSDRRMIPAPFSAETFFAAKKNDQKGSALQGIDAKFNIAATAFKPVEKVLSFKKHNLLAEISQLVLPRGSYLIIARKKGYSDTKIPIVIHRGDEKVVKNVLLLKPADIPKGFVYVPGGDFIMGGDPEAPFAEERIPKAVPGFLMSRHEVTAGEYLQFINFMEARLPGSAEKYLPRRATGSGFYWKKSGNRYQIAAPFSKDWPVLGISWNDARAYCKYLTNRHKDKGWEFRLPEDWEWEKAARGVDGRYFPWGNYFDYSFCSMASSLKGKREGPSPIGSFPLDESAFGVNGMAGNVSEWCKTFFDKEKNMRINKGSAWSYADKNFARCAGRNGHSPPDVSDSRGFRIAKSLRK